MGFFIILLMQLDKPFVNLVITLKRNNLFFSILLGKSFKRIFTICPRTKSLLSIEQIFSSLISTLQKWRSYHLIISLNSSRLLQSSLLLFLIKNLRVYDVHLVYIRLRKNLPHGGCRASKRKWKIFKI